MTYDGQIWFCPQKQKQLSTVLKTTSHGSDGSACSPSFGHPRHRTSTSAALSALIVQIVMHAPNFFCQH
jgi:hypothetical protein